MRLVGPSGFDGGAVGGFTPGAGILHQHGGGSSSRVDKSNASNATIFRRSLYYRRSEPPLSRSCKKLSHFTAKMVQLRPGSGKYYLERRRCSERKTLSSG